MIFSTLNLRKFESVLLIAEITVATIVIIATVIGAFAKYTVRTLPVSYEGITDKVVILDAGHGGEDSGAIGVDGALEKDLNFSITKILGELLESEGIKVIYTRTGDKLLYKPEEDIKGIRKISDLKNRCKIAAENPQAIFVSIHMNSYGAEKYSGLQVYYSENDKSRQLAESIQSSVVERVQPSNNRRIKLGRGIYVLDNVDNTAVLVECGFLSNRTECKNLSQKEYQKRLSFSIFCGIIEYINNLN